MMTEAQKKARDELIPEIDVLSNKLRQRNTLIGGVISFGDPEKQSGASSIIFCNSDHMLFRLGEIDKLVTPEHGGLDQLLMQLLKINAADGHINPVLNSIEATYMKTVGNA